MSEVAAQKSREAGGAPVTAGAGDSAGSTASSSTAEQAKGKLQEGAEVVQEKGAELKSQAGERVRLELDTRSTQAGEQLQGTGEALRRTGEQLRQEGKETPAKVTGYLAERTERLGSYLSSASSDQLLRDVEDFARRQPWLMAAAGATAGFLASRFLKASGSRGSEGGSSREGTRSAWQPAPTSPNVIGTAGDGGGMSSSVTRERGDDTMVVAAGGGSGGRPEH
jgi:ElaB/YqjD/DUF883 family membrane-anchored ribosome-binding protein